MVDNSDQQLVEYIQHASAALEQAGAIHAADEERRRKVASATPDTVDAVINSGLIDISERAELQSRLGDHAFTLKLLKQAALRLQARETDTTSTLGGPVKGNSATKRASAERTYWGGQRVTNDERPSSRNWDEALGF